MKLPIKSLKKQKTDLDLIKNLCSLDEFDLLVCLKKILSAYGYKQESISLTADYLIAEGDLPIVLVVHCDTVFNFLPQEWIYDNKQKVLWSPTGAGFDDRAGIFIILKIIEAGYRPCLIFTTEEEIGGVGAMKLAQRFPQVPFSIPIKGLIELDRMGSNDCVFYDCVNKDFQKKIESYGFITQIGTFTDISILAPSWGVCAVNLSVGYYDEHTPCERLYLSETYLTLDKVKKMLDDCADWPKYQWIKKIDKTGIFRHGFSKDSCFWCGRKNNLRIINMPEYGLNNVFLCDVCSSFLT